MPRKPVVMVNLDRIQGIITAEVFVNGKPATGAEVQWRPRSPWRPAAAGKAQYVEADPNKCLSAIRFNPPRRLFVTARVPSGRSYAQSKTLEIEI